MADIYLPTAESFRCIVVDGHKSVEYRKIRGMGGSNKKTKYGTLTFNLMLSDRDVSLLYDWWVNEIDYGYKPFKVDGRFFGFTGGDLLTVRLTNDLSVQMEHLALGKITMEVEVLNDMSTAFWDGIQDACDSLECSNLET